MRARHRLATLAALVVPTVALSLAGAAWAGQDRYGPPAVQDQAPASEPSPRTYLSWPSKEAQPATAAQSPADPARTPASVQGAAQGAFMTRPLRPAQTVAAMQRPAERSAPSQRLARVSPQRPTPAPIRMQASAPPEATPPAAHPQSDAISANGAPPRFYSVQRQFGVTPEQASLQPQFFTDAASTDLAGPPPPPAPHLIAGQSASSAANVQRANAAADIADGDPTTSN